MLTVLQFFSMFDALTYKRSIYFPYYSFYIWKINFNEAVSDHYQQEKKDVVFSNKGRFAVLFSCHLWEEKNTESPQNSYFQSCCKW